MRNSSKRKMTFDLDNDPSIFDNISEANRSPQHILEKKKVFVQKDIIKYRKNLNVHARNTKNL